MKTDNHEVRPPEGCIGAASATYIGRWRFARFCQLMLAVLGAGVMASGANAALFPRYETRSVGAGSLGQRLFQLIGGSSGGGGSSSGGGGAITNISVVTNCNDVITTVTNIFTGNVVIIGDPDYISLIPEASACLTLETTASTNTVTMRIYSRDSLYTLLAEDSTLYNGRDFTSITFSSEPGKIYDVQMMGTGNVTLFFKLGIPPAFTQTPTNQAVAEGCRAILTASASGLPAPTYQWRFNNAILAGETNATLTIANAQPSSQGNYRVSASNLMDSITSPAVSLQVIPSAVRSASLTAEGLFQFTGTGLPGQRYAVETSTNLIQWTPISTNVPGTDGAFTFTDAQTAGFPARLFRIATLCP